MENTEGKILINASNASCSECLNKINDFTLLKMCAEFGGRARYWRQKFIGLLPEVNKRRLYEKKKCGSIFEFAYKFAGLSEKQVKLAIHLDEEFEDKPELHNALINGDVSLAKIARVASVATPKNAAELLESVKNLPQKTLEVRVRDLKKFQLQNALAGGSNNGDYKNENGLVQPLFGPKVLRTQKLKFEFSDEIIEELNRLYDQGHDMDKIEGELLEMRKQKIEQEKQEISAEVKEAEPTKSRYVQKKIKNVLEEEYGKKCAVPSCNKPSLEVHHTLPFSIAHTHDPQFMVPLCREHHQIAHLANLKYAERLRKE